MNWTPEQKQTIETRNKNILVSAAAGSGKTAVLVERIKQLMIRDKVDIDRFLITTFTNAAAAEMKERLEKAVREALEESEKAPLQEPGQQAAHRAFLKRQLTLMSRASISTFHTFALEVMHRFFYVTDLEPGFKIGDEAEISIMKNQAADQLFEDRFREDYGRFTGFLRKYSSHRSENRIKANLISLYDEMRSIPDYMNWARERTELLKAAEPSKALGLTAFIGSECLRALKEAEEHYAKAADLLEEAGIASLCAKAQQDAEKIRDAAAKCRACGTEAERIDTFCGFCSGPKFNTMRAAKAEQEDYDAVKEQVTAHRKRGKSILEEPGKKYMLRALEEYDGELRDSYEDTAYLLGLLQDFETIFHRQKQEKNMTDFDDVMHCALAILQDEMAASEYRDRFRYIFIDEFQDSNMLQEAIVKRIAGENNLFMVGDVKQSIYKFRLAEPEIFKRKYAEYAGEEDNSLNIDLNSNFRSKCSVTGTVNNVFRTLLEDYGEKARLHCTIDEAYPGFRSQLHIIGRGKDAAELPDNPRLEAQQAERIIRAHLGREIYDVKAGRMRPMEYGDMAVLSRSRSMIGELERYLNNAGIPAYGENTGGYYESVEIQVFVNLLQIVDNSRQDIPLISVMRSAIFDFDVKELAAIRIFHRDGAYHEAVKRYAEDGPDDALREKIAAMLEKIAYWKKLKTSVSLEELVRVLMYDTGYFDYCSGLPVGKQRVSNLRMLVEKAGRFEQNNHSGLYGFLSYIDAMKKSRLTTGEAKLLGEGENVVRVMTVHKSKGLEFPLVILTGAGKTIKSRGAGASAVMHKDFAIGLPHVDLSGQWHRKTLLQRAIEGKKAREAYEEEIRILYVAMTRAMDGLVITGVVKDPDKLAAGPVGKKSFLEMVYAPMAEEGAEVVFHSAAGEETDEGAVSARAGLAGFFARCREKRDEAAIRKIDERLSFVYPYADMENVKSKYSVTELSRRKDADRSEGHALIRPGFSQTEKVLSAADIGTAMHLVMEKLDFSTAEKRGKAYIRETAEMLRKDGWLSDAEFDAINVENIEAFFNDPIGKRVAAAEALEKEREFILRKEIGGVSTIVQGIIDCCFAEKDGIVLIDYKNSRLENGAAEEDILRRYGGQMELYREALEAAEGMRVKEAYLYLFTQQKFVKTDW